MDKYKKNKAQEDEELTLRGKTPDEIDQYLLSGEPDDLSYEYFEDA